MKKIYIDIAGQKSRIAVVDEGRLVELIHDDRSKKIIAGNIYTALIKNILQSRFAFVDIGDEKNAFLYLNDRKEDRLYKHNEVKGTDELTIKQGGQIPVQVLKEAAGDKGATVTSQLSFSGKLIVLIYNSDEIGVSKKITDKTERQRLKQIAKEVLPQGYGVIMRTKCEGLLALEIEDEIKRIVKVCEAALKNEPYIKAPAKLYDSLSEVMKIIRDLFNEHSDKIIVNDEAYYKNLKECIGGSHNIELYEGEIPLFDNYLLESQIEKALNKKVWLKSGGFIVIEQTEACVTVDVNTGKFTGKDHEQTVTKTNVEAAIEIARQIRLRNLSGIIIIDFIDMQRAESRTAVKGQLKYELKSDRASTTVIGMSGLGLMQLTRKKIGESLESALTTDCVCCGGKGRVLNENYLALKIRDEITLIFSQTTYNQVTIKSSEKVIKAFAGCDADYKLIEEKYNKKIVFETVLVQRHDYYEILKQKV